MGRAVLIRLVALLGALCFVQAHAETLVSIGTGEPNGVYYPVTQAICSIVNRQIKTSDVRCSAEATPGSAYNIEAMRTGDLDMGIVQSDMLAAAHDGVGPFAGHPFPELRTVVLLHTESVAVLVRADSGFRTLQDLSGHRVNIGGPGSGTRIVWDMLTREWGPSAPAPANMPLEAATDALCHGRIEANLLVVGQPSPQVAASFAACKVTLLPVEGPVVDAVLRAAPYYSATSIPGQMYGLAHDVPTFGGKAVLAAPNWLEPQVTDLIARSVQASLAELRRAHPALEELDTDEKVNARLPAPLHLGVMPRAVRADR